MALFYDAARIAARAASQQPAQQQKPREWQPFTKLVWLVFIFGIPIALGGAWRVGAFVVLGAIAASVLAVIMWGSGHSARRADPAKQARDEAIERVLGERL